ncbi:TDT family transporter [Raineyella fluvialis]|uniref:C4-dicarboxylate ABC transporter n=1 Tax=Raineyella fluvialis TaxID=2662261 RepID=A0A5Q2FBN6_9ACTN|nr:TDT family transporter [Raineyella fluvialis]QGF22824.1 C4-dicarboxylate ABC transporter [Raineyella fluvialis]
MSGVTVSLARPVPPATGSPCAPVAALPPLGPSWYPAVMGTGILGTLLQTFAERLPGAQAMAGVAMVLAWTVLIVLTAGFLRRVAHDRRNFTVTVRDTDKAPMWGTVSMGLLAVGSCTATVVPAWWPELTSTAWLLDGVLWSIGTLIGLLAALGFGARLVGRDCGAPTTVWGLAVVGPMVSATTGAALVPRLVGSAQIWLLMTTITCFFLSLCLGTIVFTVAYHHHWRVAPIALVASASAWIPLGMVGQSTAAVQSIAAQAKPLLALPVVHIVQQAANAYGYLMLGVGIPLVGWAVVVTGRGFLLRMPFSPGWWALTFPIGTLALGAVLLGRGTGQPFLTTTGEAATLILAGTVTLCLIASIHAVARRGLTA